MKARSSCLITGGAGFLGKHIVETFQGSFSVSVLDNRKSTDPSIQSIVGDIRDYDQVHAACTGMESVVHTASAGHLAKDSMNMKLAHEVNVLGTKNIIRACQELRIPKLVYTSSAGVVFGSTDMDFVDESIPYAQKPLDHYIRTKVEAEKLVLSANGKKGLATVALRPSSIFGEGDRACVPELISQAKEGKTKYIVGSEKKLMDFIYAGNLADAHLLAAQRLSKDHLIAGKPYFITNDEPYPFWGFVGDVLEPLGYERPHIHIPFWLPYYSALLKERILFPLVRPFMKNSQFEFQSARLMIIARNRTFSINRAKRDLGFSPKINMEKALARTIAYYKNLEGASNESV